MRLRLFAPGGWVSALLLSGAVVVCLGIVRGESTFSSYFELKQSRAVLSQRVTDLKKENAGLQREITRIKESPSYAKKVLRDKYHVTEPGENIIFFAE